MARSLLLTTFVCGSLDILYAIALGLISGNSASGVLQSVASGPFGNVQELGLAGALIGLAVHFAIMAAMVAALAVAFRYELMDNKPAWLIGIGYGFMLYVIMYWAVLPLRWPGNFPQTAVKDIAGALFAHVVLVGLPMAYMLRKLRTTPAK